MNRPSRGFAMFFVVIILGALCIAISMLSTAMRPPLVTFSDHLEHEEACLLAENRMETWLAEPPQKVPEPSSADQISTLSDGRTAKTTIRIDDGQRGVEVTVEITDPATQQPRTAVTLHARLSAGSPKRCERLTIDGGARTVNGQ